MLTSKIIHLYIFLTMNHNNQVATDGCSGTSFLVVGCSTLNQCPSLKSSMAFKCDLDLQNIPLSKQPLKMQPHIKNENITWSSQYNLTGARTNKCKALLIQEVGLDGWFLILTLYWKHVPCNSCTSLTWVLDFHSTFLDWRLGFEPTLQMNGWNSRALQNETHMRASILNTALGHREQCHPRAPWACQVSWPHRLAVY